MSDFDELYQQITSRASRAAADRLFAATGEELNATYKPGLTETNTQISDSVKETIMLTLKDPGALAAFELQMTIIETANLMQHMREQAGLTQQDLADRLHIDVSTIEQVEDSEAEELPALSILREIVKACNHKVTHGD